MSQGSARQRRRTAANRFARALARALARRRNPVSTYRLQLSRSFTFDDARGIVPYLQELGVTDVYVSPCFQAGRDSDHGYDITDHNVLNPTLGTAEGFDALSKELRKRGMGLILDIVPNHMGITGVDNAWWMDVLENGQNSPYAPYFDIDWHPLKAGSDLENRILLPILSHPYGNALERQDLALRYAEGEFFVTYQNWRMPIAPRGYAELLSARLDRLTEALGSEHGPILELRSIITAINYLPLETDTEPEKVAERQREKQIIKQRIAKLVDTAPEVYDAILDAVREYNGVRGQPRSFDLLDRLLDSQSYRLAFWQVAAEEINYRRFFDVNELAAIRMEHPGVFEATHRLAFALIRQGKVTGLRIDHGDGLWDPAGYLRRVQLAALSALSQDWLDENFGMGSADREVAESELIAWYDRSRGDHLRPPVERPLYVVVEKILSRGERLPTSWWVDGTTGYDFANLVNGLFIDSSNRGAMTRLYSSFARSGANRLDNLINSTKKIIMLVSMASEVNELGYQLKRIASKNRQYRDFTLNSLTHATREVIAALPVYRTYLVAGETRIEAHDAEAIEAAVAEARRRNPRTAASVFDFVRAVLLQQLPDGASELDRQEWSNFVMRFQQTSGPVMAKGVEDTAFYVYNRLISLNEVGGDPDQFGVAPSAFHRENAERLRSWPHTMNGGSTHDSKRSADVRARLNVLSEIPDTWHSALVRWSRQNRRYKTLVDGEPAPDRSDEYFLYQTLVGAWPLEPPDTSTARAFRQRIHDYLQKAIKEAKIHSSWVNPNRAYDEAVARFVGGLLGESGAEKFRTDFLQFQATVSFFGMLNALSQTLLQLTSPGVPDIYRGNELWDFSLVDPDNRRTVDFHRRETILDRLCQEIDPPGARVEAAAASFHVGGTIARWGSERGTLARLAERLLDNWRDGAVKLYLMHRVLTQRRSHADVFHGGAYFPLEAEGEKKDHVVAFARGLGDDVFVSIVPRLPVGLTSRVTNFPVGRAIWGDTLVELSGVHSGQVYRNLLTGETSTAVDRGGTLALELSDVMATFPVAFLKQENEP